jgi:hypothetical protein
MQNTSERLLAGIAASLRETVAPAVADAYALAQVQAAAEILDNLAGRLVWRTDDLRGPAVRWRALVLAASERAPVGELPRSRAWLAEPEPDPPDIVDWGRLLDAVAEVQAWLARPGVDQPELRARLRDRLADESERERRLLRTGMYRRAATTPASPPP